MYSKNFRHRRSALLLTLAAFVTGCGQSSTRSASAGSTLQAQTSYPDMTTYGSANARASYSGTLAGATSSSASSTSSSSSSKSNKGLWIGLGIAGVVGVGVLAWYLLKKKKSQSSESNSQGGLLSRLFGGKKSATKVAETKPSENGAPMMVAVPVKSAEEAEAIKSAARAAAPLPASIESSSGSHVEAHSSRTETGMPAPKAPALASQPSSPVSASQAKIQDDCKPEEAASGVNSQQVSSILRLASSQFGKGSSLPLKDLPLKDLKL